MRYNTKSLEKFVKIKVRMENKIRRKILYLRMNRGKKYISTNFSNYLEQHKIKRDLTMAYISQQNKINKQKNHTIIERAKSMVASSKCFCFL